VATPTPAGPVAVLWMPVALKNPRPPWP
jgi:hypothetical protein